MLVEFDWPRDRSRRSSRRTAYSIALPLFVVATGLILQGCSKISDSFAVDRLYKTPESTPEGLLQIDRVKPVNLETLTVPGGATKWYPLAAQKENQRNRLQAYLMKYSNRICEFHKSAIVGHRAAFNLAAGILNVGAGAAGSLVSGGSSQLLSALSAMISGTQATVNVEVYQKYLAPAITKRIDVDREEIRKDITANRAKSIEAYTVDDAILDVQRYHLKCSFYSALSSLIEEGAKSPEEQTSISKIIELEQKKVAALDAEITALQKSKSAIASDQKKSATAKKLEIDAIDQQIADKKDTAAFLRNRIAALRGMLGG